MSLWNSNPKDWIKLDLNLTDTDIKLLQDYLKLNKNIINEKELEKRLKIFNTEIN